jgi:hypothetical protein
MSQTITVIPGDGIGLEVTQVLTVDMGGGASTTEYTDALVGALA